MAGNPTHQGLAATLPDIPRWLEPRSMLLSGACEVFGAADGPEPTFVSFSPYMRVSCVVGRPPVDAIKQGASRLDSEGDLLAYADNVDYAMAALPSDWTASPAVLHLLGDSGRLPVLKPTGPGGMHARPFIAPHAIPSPYDCHDDEIIVRLVSSGELTTIEGASRALLEEVQRAALVGKLAVVFLNRKPVSFCDAASETETLWDIGIETLKAHQNRGYGSLAVAYMIDQMGRRGKRPVWGAEESNIPSMRLAAKLGFRPVDRLFVVYPPA